MADASPVEFPSVVETTKIIEFTTVDINADDVKNMAAVNGLRYRPSKLKKSCNEHIAAVLKEHQSEGLDRKYLELTAGNNRKGNPVSFAWRNVTLKVPIKTDGMFMGFGAKDTGNSKFILKDVSGYVEPGTMLYIMGPSGAGKSTMLDALADRVKTKVTGVQWLNGAYKKTAQLKEVSKYVQQEDCLLGALTTREVLNCAANFYVIDSARRLPLVEAVLLLLGLTEQGDTKIGDQFFRGLSGGQKRRVSVGIELLAEPHMLFLDEPTSGLDSASAFSIMTSLRHFAKATQTPFLITIHQPSERLFAVGDSLLLLTGGSTAYFGPIAKLEQHFATLGFQLPVGSSMADWLLDLINRNFGEHDIVDSIIQGWDTSAAKKVLDEKLVDMQCPMQDSSVDLNDGPVKYRTSQYEATLALLQRGFTNAKRAPAVIWFRFAMYLMLSVLIGTVWLQLGDSAKVITDVNGALFFTTAFMIFMSISVLPMYLEERNIFIRERGNSSYSVASYIIAHTVFEAPFIFLLSLCCSLLVYWLVGFVASGTNFFIFVANLFIGLMVAESIMMLIAACIPYFIVGIAVGAFTFGAFMCVMGYFIAFSQIGWWWKWMRYIAVHYYNFSTFMTNQYWGRTYSAYCPDPTAFPCYSTAQSGTAIVQYYDLEDRIWLNFVVQLAMIVIFRLFAGFYLHYKVTGKK